MNKIKLNFGRLELKYLLRGGSATGTDNSRSAEYRRLDEDRY